MYSTTQDAFTRFVFCCVLWWLHENVIKWKHFPHYWPFVRGIHRLPVNSPNKGQWGGASMISLIWAWINGWVNNREAGDLRRHRAHYDVTVMRYGSILFKLFRIPSLALEQSNEPLAGYVKLRVAYAPGMTGRFSPPPRVSDPDRHHAWRTCRDACRDY